MKKNDSKEEKRKKEKKFDVPHSSRNIYLIFVVFFFEGKD
jgi:hypothetical protein